MKITCQCGATILDQGAYKAHFIPDLAWDRLLEAVDHAIEGGGFASKEARAMAARQAIAAAARAAWQCGACGRLYFDGEGRTLRAWTPSSEGPDARLFGSRET